MVTATIFKNLCGFGGGLFLSKETDLERKLDNAVFYEVRGSDPECNCGQGYLGEVPKPDFVVYVSQSWPMLGPWQKLFLKTGLTSLL